MLWQGVNWLGPAVCMCTGVCLRACLLRHTNVCVCICQRVDSVSSVRASLRGPAHVALLQSEWLFPLFLTCALCLPSPVQPCLLCEALSEVDQGLSKTPTANCVAEENILAPIDSQLLGSLTLHCILYICVKQTVIKNVSFLRNDVLHYVSRS